MVQQQGRGRDIRRNRTGAGDTVHAGQHRKGRMAGRVLSPADGGLPQRHRADERTVIETDKYTEVIISNDSRKIEQEEIQKLPERGYRGINTISKGTGLGLTLAKAILDDCEADFKIEVIDVSKEKSIFKVRFKFYTYKKHREKS